MDPDKRNLK